MRIFASGRDGHESGPPRRHARRAGTRRATEIKRNRRRARVGLRLPLIVVLAVSVASVGLLSWLSTTTGTAAADTTGDMVIFDNAIQSGWVDASYGVSSINSCDSTRYVSAPCSYSGKIWGDSAISFGRSSGTISTSTYKSLDWYVYLNGWSITSFRTYLEDANGNHIKDVYLSSSNVVGATPNGFTRVSVPMSTLNPSNTPVAAFRLLKNNSQNTSTPRIWVDDVRFVASGSSQTPTPSPSPSPTATPVNTPTPTPSPTTTPTPSAPSNWKAVNIGDPSEDWSTGTNSWNWTAINGDLDDVKNAGIGYVRVDLEYTTPLSFYDQLFSAIGNRGITPIVIVKKNPPTDDLGDATSRATFKSWLNTVVTRYGKYTNLWEIGNEPNLGEPFWNTPTAPSQGGNQSAYDAAAQNYIAHLQDAYTTIKAVQSNSIVLCGGISEWTMEDWVKDLIKFGAAPYMDALAFHPYSNDGPTGVVNRLKDFRAAIGADPNGLGKKPIYITEVGFNTAGWNPGGVSSESTKATYLQQTVTGLRNAGITTPIVWYCLHEGNSGTAGFGLVAKDPTTLKTTYLPAYYTYRDLK